MNPNLNIYEKLGGAEKLRKLVELFYSKVQAHPRLGPLFPTDIAPVMDRQYRFLTQFFGGPQLYSELYGQPMMRARHMHVPITEARAEEWLECMGNALEEFGVEEPLRLHILHRLAGPARHFVNMPGRD